MNILFISYEEVSLCRNNVRTVAMLYALADAGHQVDLLAPRCDLPDHPHIRFVWKERERPPLRTMLRFAALRAAGRSTYDAVHAVDEAVFFAARISGWKQIPLVYDAFRCYHIHEDTGMTGKARLFPSYYRQRESRILDKKNTTVFSPCSALSNDLAGAERSARIVQIEGIPAQPLHARRYAEPPALKPAPGQKPEFRVVCSALPNHAVDLRTLFMAVRKVVEAAPGATFLFRGVQQASAEKMARNLDIADHCAFLAYDDPDAFLAALESADAVLMLPGKGHRYLDPQVYTLLHAPSPLVTLYDKAYDDILTDQTAVRVLPAADTIADALLRVIQEPLFSVAIALEGQQRVADHHSYSSFKHKVRMAYHDLGPID